MTQIPCKLPRPGVYLMRSAFLILLSTSLLAVEGNTYIYTSPNGLEEACIATSIIPNGQYSKKDLQKEKDYCSLDFMDSSYALCPKTWSTSPATMIYSLQDSDFDALKYESHFCASKTKPSGVKTFAKFKQTMNANGTSGTFSKSSLLYYHFSRYFKTEVNIPVAVYRSMDKDWHLDRVSLKGQLYSKASKISAGWNHLVSAEKNPSTYRPLLDLFTPNQQNIYGVLIKGEGERYGSELNGTRASGWGKGQNYDFQKTPAYLALRNKKDLKNAMKEGLRLAGQDSTMLPDLKRISEAQMIYWMRELIEITLLDYIFSQQDRIGNIDYKWYWYWNEEGKLYSKKETRNAYKNLSRKSIARISPPEEIASFQPTLIQRTFLNDNDAGVRYAYTNFSKNTGMLENLEHYSADIYNRLMQLNNDFQTQGAIYQWLKDTFDLSEKNFNQIIINTKLASQIIRSQCSKLQFDLDSLEHFVLSGNTQLSLVDCL